MRVVIIDDCKAACEELRARLQDVPSIQVEGMAHNGFDGLDLVSRTHPDVVFLDVELPDISGLNFLERSSYLRESDCRVVIYTAYDKYILPALRLKAHDVLLKPITNEEFGIVMSRLQEPAKTTIEERQKAQREDPRYVLFTNSVDFTIIGMSDIGVFQYDPACRCWSAMVSSIPHPVRLRSKICAKDLLQLGDQYVQVHQRFIVNIDYLLNVVDNHCHFFPPFDSIDHVTVGRVFREKLLNRFNSL